MGSSSEVLKSRLSAKEPHARGFSGCTCLERAVSIGAIRLHPSFCEQSRASGVRGVGGLCWHKGAERERGHRGLKGTLAPRLTGCSMPCKPLFSSHLFSYPQNGVPEFLERLFLAAFALKSFLLSWKVY